MSHLTPEQKAFFKENGYLIVRRCVDRSLTDPVLDLVWANMEEKRDDPITWIDKGYRVVPNVAGSEAAKRLVNDSPIIEIAEEMAGPLRRGGGAAPHVSFPRSNKEWRPAGGHLDGYHTPTNGVPKGTVGRFTVGVTIYVAPVKPRGGGFTFYPGSHRVFAEYFRTHPLDGPQGGVVRFPVGEATEFTGDAGDVCFWHYWLYHTAGVNAGEDVRIALIARLSRPDANETKFLPLDDNLWKYWDGLR